MNKETVALTHEVLDMIRLDLQNAGFTVKKYKSVYGWKSGCLQVMPGHLLPSVFLFVDGSKLLFSRFMNLTKMRYRAGGLHYMELADPNAKPGELLLKLFKADAELQKNLRTYSGSGEF